MRLRRTRLWLGGALAVVAGCLSPTLPLPPPEEPDGMAESVDAAGETVWEVHGTCVPGAEVVVINDDTGRGAVFVDRDRTGRYAVTVEGEECDLIVLSQSVGTEGSGETRVILQEVVNGAVVDPAACNQ